MLTQPEAAESKDVCSLPTANDHNTHLCGPHTFKELLTGSEVALKFRLEWGLGLGLGLGSGQWCSGDGYG